MRYDEQKQNINRPSPASIASIATFFAAITSALTANAQDASESTSDVGQPKLEEVLVTAQKREERVQDVPEAISVLDPQVLEQNGQDRLIDYFAAVPGLNISTGGNGNTLIVMRGLSTGAGGNPLTSTVIDDVPVTAASAAGGGAVTSPDLDPSDLARIEVLKGPQGTLYGADSVSGLIKYVTVDPSTSAWSGRAELSGVDIPGGGLGYVVRAAINIPVSDTFALRVSGFDRRDPGYIDQITSGQKNFNASDVYGSHVAALWHPVDNLSVKLSALFQQTDGNESQFDSTISGSSVHNDVGLTALPGSTYYTTKYELYSANVDWKVAGLDIVSITGFAINSYENFIDWTGDLGTIFYNCYYSQPLCSSFSPPLGRPEGMLGATAEYSTNTRKVSQELRVGASVGHWLDWRLGGFYTHEDAPTNINNFLGNNFSTGAFLFTGYTNAASIQNFNEHAVFGDLTLHLSDRFDVDVGGRQSWNRQETQFVNNGIEVPLLDNAPPPVYLPLEYASGSAFTYQVSPRFEISHDLMVYVRVATGYRVGGYNTIAFSPGYTQLGIPTSYAPDKATNYEVGVKGDFLQHVIEFNAAAYYIAWKDIQIGAGGTFDLPNGTTEFISYELNGGQAKSEGLELELQAHPFQGLTIGAQGSYSNAVLTQDLPGSSAGNASAYALKGFQLPYSMKFSGGITVNQDILLSNKWTGFVGGAANYIDNRPQEFASVSSQPRWFYPAYTQINFHLGARHDTWLTTLYLNNATSARGVIGITTSYSYGTPQGYNATIIQPRTIGISLAKTF